MKLRYGIYSLRFKLILAGTLVEAVLLTLLVANSVRLMHNSVIEQTQIRLDELTPLFNASLTPPLAERDYATLQNILSGIVQARGLEYIQVIDHRGSRVARAGRAPAFFVEDAGLREAGEGHIVDQQRPLQLSGQLFGKVQFGISTEPLESATAAIFNQGVGIALCEILATFVLLTAVGVFLTRNLFVLADGARKIAAGDLEVKLNESGRDEIGDTARAFNHMTASLRRHIQQHGQAMQALKESEENLRSLADNANDGIMITRGPGGAHEYANPRLAEITGYSVSELLSASTRELAPADEYAKIAERYQKRLRGERVSPQYDTLFRRKDGTTVPVEISSAMTTWQGRPGVIVVVRDISNRKRYEKKIAHLNRLYSVLSEINKMIIRTRTVPELYHNACRIAVEHGLFRLAWIGVVDPAGQRLQPVAYAGFDEGYLDYIRVNDAPDSGPAGNVLRGGDPFICNDIEHHHSRTVTLREQALKRGYRSFCSFPLRLAGHAVAVFNVYAGEPQFFDEEQARLLSDLADDISFALDFIEQERQRKFAEADRERLLKELMAKNAEMENFVYTISHAIDQERQRKFAEADRERLLKELTAKNAEMENFVYTISHDLKSPLITIGGYAGMLEKDIRRQDKEKINEDLAEISKATTHMQTLIDDLLALSRTGRIMGKREPVDLQALLKEVIRLLNKKIASARAVVHLAPDLPYINVDRKRFAQVFENLIDNAVKYRRPRLKPKIEIGYRHHDFEPLIYVRDNGKGINPAYLERIFELFERADTDTEGTGVGLAIARRIVEVHGGRLWAESVQGRGSTLWIALPRSVIVTTN
ncbi:MAG TPA: ATP-binding protein [Acidiferrobacterales bacterium]|nr:ATP-binding protein [Acidiferrobacterales bacterium]